MLSFFFLSSFCADVEERRDLTYLTWMVLNNLALMYAKCGSIPEAIHAYRVLIKHKEMDPLWRYNYNDRLSLCTR